MSGIIDDRLDAGSQLNSQNPVNIQAKQNEEEEKYAQEIPLPSLGISYVGLNHLKETITVRPLDWRDEDYLTTQHYVDDMIVFDKILDRVILDKTLKRPLLTTLDRDTILLWLRAQEFGPIVEVTFPCPRCDHKQEAKWDLSKIEIPSYDDEVLQQLTERKGEYLITTPLRKLDILIKIPNLEELDSFKKRSADKKKTTDPDKISSEATRMIVSGIILKDENGEVTKVVRMKNEIEKIFDEVRLPISDLRYIRKEFQRIELKYDTYQDVVCSQCGYIQEDVELPVAHKNFFWMDI